MAAATDMPFSANICRPSTESLTRASSGLKLWFMEATGMIEFLRR
jgi:hypothetical protein